MTNPEWNPDDKLWLETMLDYCAKGHSDMEAMSLANKDHGIVTLSTPLRTGDLWDAYGKCRG